MWAAFLALQSFIKDEGNMHHVKLLLDNTVTLNCLRKMGSNKSSKLYSLTGEIWNWCIKWKLWISTSYIPGVQNIGVDEETRKGNLDSEWMLNTSLLFQSLTILKFELGVDLSASLIHRQFLRYVSYRLVPYAFAIDAFSIDWCSLKFYLFPPFSLLSRYFKKNRSDNATGVIVAPY